MTDPPVSQDARRQRSRVRTVITHVLWSAAFIPLLVKWAAFVVLAAIKSPVAPAVLVWLMAAVAAHVWATRRSLRKIRNRLVVERPESCLLPCMIGFAGFLFFSFLLDIAAANNAANRPGGLILLSSLTHFGLFAWMSWATQKTLLALQGANPGPRYSVGRVLTPVGDLVLLVALVTLIVLVNS